MRFSKVLNVVGCHVGGEVGNVVVGGVGDVPGATMFDKRLYLERERDDIRQLLLREPRGSMIRSANIVLPATDPRAAMGYVTLESEEYPAMSGGNTICVATVLLETGMVPMQEPVTELTLESPAGPDPASMPVSRRQGVQRPFRRPAGVRLSPGRSRRGAGSRRRGDGRGVGWDGLRDRGRCLPGLRTGAGTSARLAVMHARDQIRPGETFVHESLIGSTFDSTIESLTTIGGREAVVPSVAGQAWITDLSQVGLDPSDPFPLGYTLSDSWTRS